MANIDSDDVAEQESFIALAGTDNGSSVFRMLADSHGLFGGRKVVRVHTWGKNRGQNGKTDFNYQLWCGRLGRLKGLWERSFEEVIEKELELGIYNQICCEKRRLSHEL